MAAGPQNVFKVGAVGNQGNTDPISATINWTVLTPKQAVQKFVSIDDTNLPRDTTRSLKDILNADIRQLNNNNIVAACNILDAFLHQVNADEVGGCITSQQDTDLRQQATSIQHTLGCFSSSSLSTLEGTIAPSNINNGGEEGIGGSVVYS